MNKYILLMLLCLLIGCRNQGNDVVIKDIDDVSFHQENKKNPEIYERFRKKFESAATIEKPSNNHIEEKTKEKNEELPEEFPF